MLLVLLMLLGRKKHYPVIVRVFSVGNDGNVNSFCDTNHGSIVKRPSKRLPIQCFLKAAAKNKLSQATLSMQLYGTNLPETSTPPNTISINSNPEPNSNPLHQACLGMQPYDMNLLKTPAPPNTVFVNSNPEPNSTPLHQACFGMLPDDMNIPETLAPPNAISLNSNPETERDMFYQACLGMLPDGMNSPSNDLNEDIEPKVYDLDNQDFEDRQDEFNFAGLLDTYDPTSFYSFNSE